MQSYRDKIVGGVILDVTHRELKTAALVVETLLHDDDRPGGGGRPGGPAFAAGAPPDGPALCV